MADFEGLVDEPEVGRKDDGGKRDYTLLPWAAIDQVVGVLEFGAAKYSRENWRHVSKLRYIQALLRHVIAYTRGEQNDPESGLHHLAHAVCCALFVLDFEVRDQARQDRKESQND